MTGRDSSIVIEFPASRVRPAAPRGDGIGQAEVMIFTGVRIERLPEEPRNLPAIGNGLTRRRRRARR